MVKWVFVFVAALWPLVSFMGGLGFSPLITLAALAALPVSLLKMRPQLYMFFLMTCMGFAVASAFWALGGIQMFGVDAGSGAPKIRLDALRIALVLLWSALLMEGARHLEARAARFALSALALALFTQFCIVMALTAFEQQALDLFAPLMTDSGEGVQNISRNSIVLAVAAPVLAFLMMRMLPRGVGMAGALVVMIGVLASVGVREVHSGILAIAAAALATGLVLLFPRHGFRVLGVLFALAILAAPLIFGALSQGADAALATSSSEYRLAIWARVMEVVRDHPVFGAGAGSLRAITETIPSGMFEGLKLVPNHPHNMPLQVWAETGGVGALILAAALVAAGFRMPPPEKLGASGLLAAALAAEVFAISHVSFDLWNDWWWSVCGLLAATIVAIHKADQGGASQPLAGPWLR